MTSQSDRKYKGASMYTLWTAAEAGKKDNDALRRLQVRDEQNGG